MSEGGNGLEPEEGGGRPASEWHKKRGYKQGGVGEV